MTGSYLLDWAALAVSLFNTILTLWLGLTVLLNAERRSWGVWLTGGNLLLGGAFFISHSALLGHGPATINWQMNLWWRAGWGPVVILPLAWYVIMLWYAGFWDGRQPSALRRRQRPWLSLTVLLAVGLAGLLIFANPLPSYTQVLQLNLSATPEVAGMPVLILIYPFYIVLCIALSLDALRHPVPSERMMGDLARRRARPWLMAASAVLLLVSLLTGWIIFWIVGNARQHDLTSRYSVMSLTVAWFDLVIALLIAVAVILVGRAIVSYEVFTGQALPRRGLFRHWRSAIVLAGGYGLVVGGSLALQLPPIYSLLLTTALMVVFYALFSWRSFAERERHIELLRPFIASQRLYEHLLTPAAAPTPEPDAATPFRALCADILGARVAYLAALGPLAPLVGPALAYPDQARAPAAALAELASRPGGGTLPLSPQTICLPLDPDRYGGALWAVPLWSERGLIGMLLLGAKRDGGLYTKEEMEIARAGGERLIDTQASAVLARRLMTLQRQRLAQTQIADRQTRRALHDDILPDLHAAMLTLNGSLAGIGADGPAVEAVALLAGVHRQIAALLREMPAPAAPELARLELSGALRRVVAEELGSAFDEVTWRLEPEAESQARAIPAPVVEVLFYAAREAIRNAAHHGRDSHSGRPFNLSVTLRWRDGLELIVADNGVGLAATAGPDGGSGQGLALHSTMLAVVGGTLAVESTPGSYTQVTLFLPRATWWPGPPGP